MRRVTPHRPAHRLDVLSAAVSVLVLTAWIGASPSRAEEGPAPDAVPAPSAEAGATPSRPPDAPAGESDKRTKHPDLVQAKEDLRSIFDPTVIRRSINLEDELVDLDDSAWINKTKTTGTFAIGPWHHLDVGLRLMVPVCYYASEEPPAREDAFGLGDLELSTGIIGRHAPWFSHAAVFQVTFDTATEDVLGGNSTVLKPSYIASVRPLSFLGSTVEIAYNESVTEEPGVGDTRNLEINPAVNFTYPEQWLWFLAVQYKGKVDFANDDDYTNRMEVSAGKTIGDAKELSMYVKLEFPLDDKTDQYIGKLGITYFFD